jgi:hypothetical protein
MSSFQTLLHCEGLSLRLDLTCPQRFLHHYALPHPGAVESQLTINLKDDEEWFLIPATVLPIQPRP